MFQIVILKNGYILFIIDLYHRYFILLQLLLGF